MDDGIEGLGDWENTAVVKGGTGVTGTGIGIVKYMEYQDRMVTGLPG
jgi:hypothetical protein